MIKCTQVWFDYSPDEHPEEQWALQDVTLTLSPGEYVCIIGPSGSGKSTLARLLKGLHLPTKGTVWVDKYNTHQQNNLWKIRQRVGMVFQNPDHQIVASTVQDDIAFGLENLGLPIPEMKRRIERVLTEVGLTGLDRREPHHLSGGQKQRLAIAGVVAMNPEVIIFDEATSMLDPQGKKDILSIIQRLHHQKKTILHITHSMEEIFMANRVIIIAEGRIQLDIAQDQLYEHVDHLEKWGLELPLHLQLYQQLQALRWPIKKGISNQEELVKEIWRLLSSN